MTRVKTIKIRGKDYVEVSERIRYFNENFPSGSITTYIDYHENFVRCKAIVHPDNNNPERSFTGHAEEDRTQGMINKTSAVENCETSAVGRALAMMGIGIVGGVASAEEVQGAIKKQSKVNSVPKNAPSTDKQSKEIRELIVTVGAEEADVYSWIETTFAVDCLEDLTSQDADKVITALKKKKKLNGDV